jgi:predicted RNA binding protein YcfA (HicA-like mRNA interferase family)
MKIPRDLSGQDLIKILKPYGYLVTRQTGSHLRMTTEQNGQHHITIPNHDPLKIGTLSAIIGDVAQHLDKTKDELLQEIFG